MRHFGLVTWICVCLIATGLPAAAASVSANLDQCRNGSFSAPVACAGAAWVNGNAGASNAHDNEGDSISYRMRMTGLSKGTHILVIEWDVTKSGVHALDYITSWDRTAPIVNGVAPDPCSDVAGANCSAPTVFPIPWLDPVVPDTLPITSPVTLNQTKNLSTLITVPSFVMYGGTITGAAYVDHTSAVIYTGDLSQSIQITFTASNSTVVLAWGGHIAKRQEWGAPLVTNAVPFTETAANISGSPYHTRLVSLDGSGGNQDRSLSAAAVVATSSITINKNANPADNTQFSFAASPAPLSSFTLTVTSNPSIAFTGITNFASYSVAETPIPSAWKIDTSAPGGGINCLLSNISLDYGKNVFTYNIGSDGSSGSVTIALGEGDDATCTFYDKQTSGAITVVKNTVGGDGTFGFTSNFGVSSIATINGTGSQTVSNLSAGSTYNISEQTQTGWDQGTFSCTNGTASAITVVAGQTTTCTITNTKQGAIKIVKNAVGGDGTFSFTSNFGVSPITTTSGTGSQTVSNLSPDGNYNISEQALAGWDQGTFNCDHGSASAIQVLAGQTTTCTVTNTMQGAIRVVKNTVGGNGTFNFTSNFGLSALTTAGNTASQSFGNLTPGSGYSVSEVVPFGWDQTSASCDHGTISAIQVLAGQTTTCTFTNTQRGHIIVKKSTNPGGSSQSFTFTPSYDGGATFNLTDGESNDSGAIPPGSYHVSESLPTGWAQSSATCGNGNVPSAITLIAGQTVTCTFVNTQAGHIIVSKVTNPKGDPQSFSFTTTGTGYISFSLTDGQSNDSGALAAGNYSVAETTVAGWDLSSFTCDSGNPAAITLAAGQTVHCTATNTKRGHIIVKKSTNPSGSLQGFSFATSGTDYNGFVLSDGQSNDSGALVPGSYSVGESLPSGWVQSGAMCDNGGAPGAITLTAGQTVTCTFTNTKLATLKVAKNTVGGDGTFNFSGTGGLPSPAITGAFSVTTSNGAGSQTFSNVIPATYTLSENVPAGWNLTGATCANNAGAAFTYTPGTNLPIAAGENWVCTFTNAALPPNLAITKTPKSLGDTGYEVHPGGTASFTITVSNNGAGVATGVTLTDTLPSGLAWNVYSENGVLSPQPPVCTISSGTPAILSCNVGSLAASASFAVVVSATVPTGYLLPPAPADVNVSSQFDAQNGDLVPGAGYVYDWANIGIDCGSNPKVGCALDKSSGQNDDSFGNGTKEDTTVPSVVKGQIPNNKSDLTRFYITTQKVPSGSGYVPYLYLAWERVQAPNGSTDMDFELNQGTAGMSSNGVTPVRVPGDLLITYDLANGGTVPTLTYYTWLTSASQVGGQTASQVCAASTAFPCWGLGKVINTGSVQGSVNTATVTDPILAPGQSSPASLGPYTFGEAAINLYATGIFPVPTASTQCESFGTAYLKSRSSTSFTAELKDFIAPIQVRVSNCQTQFINNTAFAAASNWIGQVSDTGQIGVDVAPPSQ